MEDAVGPVFRMCDEVEFIVRAIEDDNPAGSVLIVDNGAYVRVQRSGFLRLTQVSLERHLGSGFQLSQLESIMSAFAGRIRTSSEEVVWYFRIANAALPEDA
jgi:toluene monooxygenase system protein D